MISKKYVISVIVILVTSISGGFLMQSAGDAPTQTKQAGKMTKSIAVPRNISASDPAAKEATPKASVLKKEIEAKENAKEIGIFMKDPYKDIKKFEKQTGRKVDVFLWYQSSAEDFDVKMANWLWRKGIKLQLAWEPHDPSKGVNEQPEYSLKSITRGDHDSDIRKWARQIKQFGKPVYFRPMCEMNGDWVVWSGQNNGNKPEDYIPAWRHVHDIFEQENVDNAKFIWAPNREVDLAAANLTFDRYYPGGDYVDFVGINGYNWGTMYKTPAWTSSWQSFDEIFGPLYQVATERTDKEIIIPEMASTKVGGDKAAWIEKAFSSMRSKYPKIKTVVWFNVDKETDWRIHKYPVLDKSFKNSTEKFISN